MRPLVIAFACGLLVGVLATWEAGRRWERASWAWSWASAWMSDALWLARVAAGWILGVVLVLAVAGVLVWMAV